MEEFCLKAFLEVIGGRFIELSVHRQIDGRSGGPDSEALLPVGRGNEIQALDPRPETIPRFGAAVRHDLVTRPLRFTGLINFEGGPNKAQPPPVEDPR